MTTFSPRHFTTNTNNATTAKTEYTFCALDRYTGLSPWLSSSPSSPSNHLTLTSSITTGSYPPFSPSPPSHPLHTTPRYALCILSPTPHTFSALTLLPSLIILLTSLTIYLLLPLKSYPLKISTLATSLLAAVLQQQTSANQATNATTVSTADWFSACVYVCVAACMAGAGVDGYMMTAAGGGDGGGAGEGGEHEGGKPEAADVERIRRAKRARRHFRLVPVSSLVLFAGLAAKRLKVGFAVAGAAWLAFCAGLAAVYFLGEEEGRGGEAETEEDNAFRIETPGLLGMFGAGRRKFRRRKPGGAMMRRHVSSYVDVRGWRGWGNKEVLTWLRSVEGLKVRKATYSGNRELCPPPPLLLLLRHF